MDNIDCFDDFVAAILADLYRAFPVPAFLDARTLSGHLEVNAFGAIVDENGNRSRRFEIAKATLDWLAESGYIRSTERLPYGHRNAVLTASGLHLLKAVPASLQQRESLGERLVRFVREGSLSLARETAKAVLAEGVGKAIG